MSMSDVDGIFADLGRRLGMPGLKLANGSCQLVFDQRHLVRLAVLPAQDAVVAGCAIGRQAPSAAGVRQLLRANHLRGGEGDCVFSLDADGRAYAQCAVSFAACRAGGLLPALEALLNQVEAWEPRLAQGDAPDGGRTPPPFMVNTV